MASLNPMMSSNISLDTCFGTGVVAIPETDADFCLNFRPPDWFSPKHELCPECAQQQERRDWRGL